MQKSAGQHASFRKISWQQIIKKNQVREDLSKYGSEILDSEKMNSAYFQTHHTWSTVGEHTLRVAAASLFICYALRMIHIQADIPSVVKGSLCHDLGILGRYEKYNGNRECSIKHPVESVGIARELAADLSEKTADIIERHMWPAGHSKAPNSLEAVIVSAADKYAAVEDIIHGSEIKHSGIKYAVQDLMCEADELLHKVINQ